MTAEPERARGDDIPGLVSELLRELGEDPERPGLVETPARVAESLRYLTDGYGQDARTAIGETLLDQQMDEMVLVKDIPFYSLCEHHMLPFFGSVHIAYLPNGQLVGLGKLPRLVDVFAHRLQVQERLTREIAEGLLEVANAKGVGVVVEARHLCMEMRGAERTGQFVTSCMLGRFRSDARTRGEFLALIGRPVR
jgi:GTP cyclohydrolase IA